MSVAQLGRTSVKVGITCPVSRKFGFTSRAEARRYIKNRRHTPGFHSRSVYLCLDCDQWHMTSQEKRR